MPTGIQTNDNMNDVNRRWGDLDAGVTYSSPLESLPASNSVADEKFLSQVLQAQKMKELSGRPPNERYDQLNEAIRNAPIGELNTSLNPYQAGILALGAPPLLAYKMIEGAARIGQTALSPLTGEKPSIDLNTDEGVAETVLAGAGANGTPLLGKAAFGGLHIDPTVASAGGGGKRTVTLHRGRLVDSVADADKPGTFWSTSKSDAADYAKGDPEAMFRPNATEGPRELVSNKFTFNNVLTVSDRAELGAMFKMDSVTGKGNGPKLIEEARRRGYDAIEIKNSDMPSGKPEWVVINKPSSQIEGIEKVLSDRLNEIDAKLKAHEGSYKDRVALMDERKDVQNNLLMAVKERNTKLGLRGKKTMLNDEGIPPDDKIEGPSITDLNKRREEMFPKDMPIDRVQAEIKKIQQVMRDMGEKAPTVKDIALHVYGSDEAWATRRIRDAMKKLPDTIGVDKPVFNEATTQPTALITDNVLPFTKLPANSNKTPIEAKMSGMTEAEFRQSKGMEPVKETDYGQSDREAWAANLKSLKADIADTKAKLADLMASKVTKLDDINRAKVSIRLMEDRAKGFQDALDTPALTAQEMKDMIEEQSGNYSPEGLTQSQVEEVNTVLNTIYPDSRDIFKMNRYYNSGVTEEDLWHIIDTGITAGPKGLKLIEDMLQRELKADPNNPRSSAMLQFLRDMTAHTVKAMEGELPPGVLDD